MATVRSATTSRGGTTARKRTTPDAEVSPARWAGVALVIAAIVGASFLAIVSPGGSVERSPAGLGAVDQPPSPSPSVLDTRVPSARPVIVSQFDLTDEIEIDLKVKVPPEELAQELLTLVVLRGDDEVGRKRKPKLDSTVTVKGVRLVANSANELTAALEGPGGLRGPRSDPIVVTHDDEAPSLTILDPVDRHTTYSKTYVVSGTSEVGATAEVSNESTRVRPPEQVVGTDGTFAISVKLRKGVNRILARSVGQTGRALEHEVRIERLDGSPRFTVTKPKRIPRSSLPRDLELKVEVKDDKGRKMPDAVVVYTVGSLGYEAATGRDVTNEEGRSSWTTPLDRSNSLAETIDVTVEVTSPWGGSRKQKHQIPLS